MRDDLDRRIIARLCEDIGEDLHPFGTLAEELGISLEELLARVRGYQATGRMRRFGAILRHQKAGFHANGMSVWRVPEADIERVGALIAARPEVSHAYQRPSLPDWPYNVFGMIHAHSEAECRAIAAQISTETGITDYDILFSVSEFKKTSMKY